jgi:hypothetical protein
MSRTTSRRRFTPATVISVLALFFALGGSAFAAATVGTADLQDQAVTAPKLANGGVTAKKLASRAVRTAKIFDAAVTTAKLADDSVTSVKIADLSVTSADLANNSVTTGKIADGNVTSADLATNSVNSAKIADGNVLNQDLGNNSVTSAKIADGQVRAPDLGNIIERSNSTTLAAGVGGGTVATCNTGERVISGGHHHNGVNVVNSISYRTGNGWVATFRNNDAVTRTVSTYVYCLAVP